MSLLLNIQGDISDEDEPVVLSLHSQHKPPVVLFQSNEMEEEDEDEPILIPKIEKPIEVVAMASQNYEDAMQALSVNPWDINSWYAIVEEARRSKCGQTTSIEAFSKALSQYPRFSRAWRLQAEYYIERGDIEEAETTLAKSIHKCRDVQLWTTYVDLIKRKCKSDQSKSPDELAKDYSTIEGAYEQALESVGMSFTSSSLWRAYIDYTKDLSNQILFGDRRLAVLRKIFQRALCVPMDHLDVIWQEYQSMEKHVGEVWADKVLPEFHEKFLHANAILRERKKFTINIDFPRLAGPPCRGYEEVSQLDSWNKWIRFESTNPDNLSGVQWRAYMKMIYTQCLACFAHYPEIWLSLAKFELQENGLLEARAVYREAVDAVPDSALLRIAQAELEEAHGNIDIARDILVTGFQSCPSGYTFSAAQRLLRRHDGQAAARKLFSECWALRQADKVKAHEICMAHAQMELDVNCKPDIAAKVLDLDRSAYTEALLDLRYIRLYVRALLRQGDVTSLRWIMQTALSEIEALIKKISNPELDSVALIALFGNTDGQNSASSSSSGSKTGAATVTVADNLHRRLRDQFLMWEELLRGECVLGLADAKRMDTVYAGRDKARLAYEDSDHLRCSRALASEQLCDRFRGTGVFEQTYSICERHDYLGCCFPAADDLARERAKGRLLIEELARQDADKSTAKHLAAASGSSGSVARASEKAGAAGSSDAADWPGVPMVLREFLLHLPQHTGSAANTDVTLCLRQLRTMVLPPRPEDSMSDGGKRLRAGDDAVKAGGAGWLAAVSGQEGGDFSEQILEEAWAAGSLRDDVFRQRQRARLL